MFTEKYRPKTLNEIISQKYIIKTLTNFVNQGELPHLLFNGPSGVGKTSTILSLIKLINKNSIQNLVLSVNASDDRGLKFVQNQITSFAEIKYSSKFDNIIGKKIIILDEVDSMSLTAQNALKKIMERYSNITSFCLICNYLDKIIDAIQSRCVKFRFNPLTTTDSCQYLTKIAMKEHINIDESAIKVIIKTSNGDMRRCLYMIQIAKQYQHINSDLIYTLTNHINPAKITQIITNISSCQKNFQEILQILTKYFTEYSNILPTIVDVIKKKVLTTKTNKMTIISLLSECQCKIQNDINIIQIGNITGVLFLNLKPK
jgi:replication factor C subunit 3/5